MVDVVAALIYSGEDKFMICRRAEHKSNSLLWEFAGGKVEKGETKQQALMRECKEELNIDVSVDSVFGETDYTYPDISIHLTVFNAEIISGTPQSLEHEQICYISADEIDNYIFCPADKPILEKIKQLYAIKSIRKDLFAFGEEEYKQFQCKLIPNISDENVIGIRTPLLRKYAKELFGSQKAMMFLKQLPHKYFEENNLHAFLIEQINNYQDCIYQLNIFLPYVDNWATCDSMKPRIFKKNIGQLQEQSIKWINSTDTYTIRFGIEVLMNYFLDSEFDVSVLHIVSNIKSNSYYVNMMIAWFFATALAKQYEVTLPFIENNCLSYEAHNKAIRKAIESRRIPQNRKNNLRSLIKK